MLDILEYSVYTMLCTVVGTKSAAVVDNGPGDRSTTFNSLQVYVFVDKFEF